MMLAKRKTLALTLSLTILIIFTAEMPLVSLVRANPLPEMYFRATIENPRNITYTTNTIALDFLAESSTFFPYLNFSYRLDTQDAKAIEKMTLTGNEFIPINPGVYRQWFRGSCVLYNLSEGWHNVTVHVTYALSRERPLYGGPIQLANTTFRIALPQLEEPPEPFPTTLVIASVITAAVYGIGLLVYFKKRKR